MKNIKIPAVLLALVLFGFTAGPALHTFRLSSAGAVKSFFKYTSDRLPFVSAHRGGPMKGYPENCLATFEHTLGQVHSLMEMDPHYTKDSAIVLMHDATLNRTSNGKGKVSDYTLKEIRALKLKDTEGNLTSYTIPTLDEALQWAKGKTLLVIDEKDVPMEVRVKKVVENHAENAAIIMAYNFEDAKKCYAMNKQLVMEVMINSLEKVKEFDQTGVPWENVVVFVSHAVPVKKELVDEIHKRGAMCIIGSSRNYDLGFTSGKLTEQELDRNYQSIILDGADIIEADLAIKAGTALKEMQTVKSVKSRFFN